MPRPACFALALLLAPQPAAAAPLPARADTVPAAVRVVGALVQNSGATHCRIIGARVLRDGYETLVANDLMARRTPGARVAVTISCDP